MPDREHTHDAARDTDSAVQDQTTQGAQVDAESAGGNQAELQTAAKRDPSYAQDSAQYYDVANQITSLMEGGTTKGDYGALTVVNDGGGVSYGKHQTTLTSGSLEAVLKVYLGASKTGTADTLRGYMPRVQARDLGLKTEQPFLQALKDAAKEREMQVAQDLVFNKDYWEPAVNSAQSNGIESPLGYALLYDTQIQGGRSSVLSRTKGILGGGIGDIVGGKQITEQRFLQVFVEQREARLLELAAKATKEGKTARANALRNSIYRCKGFAKLIAEGNLNVEGPDGKVDVKGPGGGTYQIEGFDAEKSPEGNAEDNAAAGGGDSAPAPAAGGGDAAAAASGGGDGAELQVIGQATITTSTLNVRSGPGTGNSKLGTVSDGQQLEVYAKEGDWLQVNYNGRPAYIHGGYARFNEQEAAASQILGTATITASALNVRSGPGTNNGKLGTVRQGASFEVLAREGDWFKVSFEGQQAWLHGGYANFTPSEVGQETTAAPQADAEVQQTETPAAAGADAQAAETESQNAAGEAAQAAAGSSDVGAATDRATVTSSTLNVRVSPDTAQAPIGKLSSGQMVDVIAKEGDWLKVIYNDQEAYVHANYVMLASEMPPSVDEVFATALESAPARVKELLEKNPMSQPEIAEARELIGAIADDRQKGDLYEVLQTRTPYASQRDNASTEGGKNIGDVMCNLTSLAMVLQTLGVPNPYPEMQYEDALEKVRRDNGLPHRTYADGWGGVAKAMGIGWSFIAGPGAGKLSKDFWTNTVRNELRSGKGVMMSIKGHIVRVQGVVNEGVVVDDPYGASVLLGNKYTFEKRNTKGEYSQAGDNNLWDFPEALAHNFHWVATFGA